jgi:hypothetical protein
LKPKIGLIYGVSLIFLIGLLVRIFNVLRFPILPIAFDPWYHMSITNSIIDQGFISLNYYRGNLLFHFFSVVIHEITGLDIFLIIKFVPVLLGSFGLLCFYILIKKITENYEIIIFSMLFLAAINFSFIFATNQFWPEIMTLPIIALSISFFIELFKNNNLRSLSMGLLCSFSVILTHDFSALMLVIILGFIFLFANTYEKNINYSSSTMFFGTITLLLVWALIFPTGSVILEIISLVYFLIPVLGVSIIITVYIFRKIRIENSFNNLKISNKTVPLWIFFTIIGSALFFSMFFFLPTINNSINLTFEYLVLAVPMEIILASLLSLGILIIFQNFNRKISLILGLITGPAILLLVPVLISQFVTPIIESERILEFAFIGGSIITAISIAYILKKINNHTNKNYTKIKGIVLVSVISFLIIPGVLWSFPTPSGGLTYLNYNTYTEVGVADWARNHINNRLIVSDWRIGYILIGYLNDAPFNNNIKINVSLLYSNNYALISSLSSSGVYLIIDDWMVSVGPTQPFSYGIALPLNDSKSIYDTNSNYTKIFDNGYEWIYFI